MENLVKARYWEKLGNNSLKCILCPKRCELKENQKGICSVRMNNSGEMVTLSYGKIAAANTDPVEKKPLYHFYPGGKIFSIGTIGCNLTCKFCQNWGLRCGEGSGDTILPEKVISQTKEIGAKLIAFTYNEPVVFSEYAIDVSRIATHQGLKSVVVSSGYISPGKPMTDFFEYIDAANIDLKAFTDDFYIRNCGARLSPVLETLRYLKNNTKIWLEITTLIIEGENDSNSEINEMIDWVLKNLGDEVPWHFSAFHPAYKFMDNLPTSSKRLLEIRELALNKGIKYPYTGNIASDSNTYCHFCGELLIQRTFYRVKNHNIGMGRCKKCKTIVPGVFENNYA